MSSRLAWWLSGVGVVIVVLGGWLAFSQQREHTSVQQKEQSSIVNKTHRLTPPRMTSLSLTSPVFEHGGTIPSKYTCDGEDVSPPLVIDGVPQEAQSLVLIMDDPDAPMGTWDHWVVFNIPPTLREIPEGTEPEGTPGRNSWGRTGYGGPCPPDREHRYFFRLYALDTTLPLPEGASKGEVLTAMEGHIIASAELMGRYNRQR